MSDDATEDAVFGKLDRLVAASKTIQQQGDRRLTLSLEADLRAVRAVLQAKRDRLAQKLSMAGARSKAATAYSRTAFLGRGTISASTTRQMTESKK